MDEYMVGIIGKYPSFTFASCPAIAALKLAQSIKAKAGTVIRVMLFCPLDGDALSYAVLPNHSVIRIEA